MREKRCPFTSPYLFFWQAGEEVEDEKEDPEAKPLIQAQALRQMAPCSSTRSLAWHRLL
jgi:hypothetical protein